MKIYWIAILAICASSQISYSQEIAIIDQGLNTTKTNKGEFYNPICLNDIGGINLGNGNYSATLLPEESATHIGITSINLCWDSFYSETNGFGANVPRFRSLRSSKNNNNQTYRVAMVTQQDVPKKTFSSPFQNMSFGAELRHGTDVANAAYDFDSSVRRKMAQVYRITQKRSNPKKCTAQPTYTISQSSGVIGGSNKIIDVLGEIAQNPDGVDAINMSIVFRTGFCDRQRGFNVPQACIDLDGLDEVKALNRLGIPFVVGLANEEIGNLEQTWPACLPGVIKVGSTKNARPEDNVDIGIGAMDVDFYAKNKVTTNRPRPGNSLAAPKIATAYALLKTAVPNSSIEQRGIALKLANTKVRTYVTNGKTYTRRDIRKTDIPQAITNLRALVRGNTDNIAFLDQNEYGPTHGETSQDYAFDIDFDDLVASSKVGGVKNSQVSAKTVTVPNLRDVVISFDAKMLSGVVNRNGFDIFINGTKRESTTYFNGERTIEVTFKRTLFTSGKNTIRIVPRSASRAWGLTNIKAEFTPVVELTLNQLDSNDYGSEEDPERPTGLRATFQIADTNSDVLFYVTGWGLRDADEVTVYLNGIEYGFLTKQGGFTDRYSPQDTFTFEKADLSEGQNVIEFVQKAGATKWGVTNMFVTLDSLSPVLPLGVKSTIKYGNNYGTNEHPIRLDATFTALSEHDHIISWRGFDIDRTADVNFYLNDRFIKSMRTTNNGGVGVRESLTMASRQFRAGVNTISFRVSGAAHDATWGVTDLLVRTSTIIDLDNENNLEKDYGYFAKYSGFAPSGWTRTYSTQPYQTRLHATFNSTGTKDKTIQITGWDIDSPEELGVYVNGTFLKYVNSSDRSSVYSKSELIRIPKASLIAGRNTISFRTNVLTGFNNEKWGVFFGKGLNLTITPIIMLLMDDEPTTAPN